MVLGKMLIRGSVLRNVEFLIMILVTFLMTPFIVHTLGNRLYGFWTLVSTFVGYYGLLDFGLTSAIGRFISREIGRGDEIELSKVVSTSLFLMFIISSVVIISILIAITSCHIFIQNQSDIDLFKKIIFIFGISLVAGFPARVFESILYSYVRYEYITSISILRIIVTNILIYYFLLNGFGIIEMTYVIVMGSIIQNILIFLYCATCYKKILIRLEFINIIIIRHLFEYSWKTFVSYLADILRFKIDTVVIARFIDISSVTRYSIGARLIEYFTQFVQSSLGGIGPLFSRYEGSGDRASLVSLFEKSTKISTSISVFIGFSIFLYGHNFIIRWMGCGFDDSYYVALILCIGNVFALMQSPSVSLLYGISKHHFYAVTNLSEGVVNIVISLLLVKTYGIKGVAFGTAISMIFFRLLIQPYYVCKCISYPLLDYYIKILFTTTLKSILPLIVYYFLTKNYISATYSSIVIFALMQVILFIPVIIFTILKIDDRKVLFETLCSKSSIV